MKKPVKITLIIIAILTAIGYGGYQYLIYYTKTFSPEEVVEYNKGSYELEVFYNRPYKKGREIFGSLVPFGKVWRTGANEATTFETGTDLTIGGQTLKAGNYTLWTIPNADSWKVIFNDKQYSWGVDQNGPTRKAEFDVLTVEVPVEKLPTTVEQFTIAFEEQDNQPVLTLSWDDTKVLVLLEH